jgi:hypothetical protein
MTKTDQQLENDNLHTPHNGDRESSQIEQREDGEDRFRAAVRAAAKSGPKHRASKA